MSMIVTKLPTVEQIRANGRFLGYSVEDGYCDVYRHNSQNYVLLDYLRNGSLYFIPARYYNRIGALAKSFSELDGSIR